MRSILWQNRTRIVSAKLTLHALNIVALRPQPLPPQSRPRPRPRPPPRPRPRPPPRPLQPLPLQPPPRRPQVPRAHQPLQLLRTRQLRRRRRRRQRQPQPLQLRRQQAPPSQAPPLPQAPVRARHRRRTRHRRPTPRQPQPRRRQVRQQTQLRRRRRQPPRQVQAQQQPHIALQTAAGWQERTVTPQEPISLIRGIMTAVRLPVFTEPGFVTATTTVTGMKGRRILHAYQTTSTMRDMLGTSRSSKNLQLSAMISVGTSIAPTHFLHRQTVNQKKQQRRVHGKLPQCTQRAARLTTTHHANTRRHLSLTTP